MEEENCIRFGPKTKGSEHILGFKEDEEPDGKANVPGLNPNPNTKILIIEAMESPQLDLCSAQIGKEMSIDMA